jgi:hypothetical protein
MTYRIRTYAPDGLPLIGSDITTDSARTAAKTARDIADEYGWDCVQVKVEGDFPLRGSELREWVARNDSRGPCEQHCGRPAEVYAVDSLPNGWGGRYCRPCAAALKFQITDILFS